MSAQQAKLAVESRAYPLFGTTRKADRRRRTASTSRATPSPKQDWPTYTLHYEQGGRRREMEIPMTFADFAVSEVRFRKHFRMAPPDTWNENMLPLAEFLELPADEREGRFRSCGP